MNKYVKYLKQVVASLKDGATGEPIHHRKWDSAVPDLPVVNQKEQRPPSLKAKTINQLVQEGEGDEQALYISLYFACFIRNANLGGACDRRERFYQRRVYDSGAAASSS